MNIALVIAVAILIEGLVEYGKTIMNMFETGEKKTAITQIITIIIGILIAVAFNADLFVTVGLQVNHVIGMILTGIIASRGSNYASDLITRIANGTVG